MSAFRIPMRGYEVADASVAGSGVVVPNPHEGL